MKLLKKISFVIAFVVILYFAQGILSLSGINFFGKEMFTELGIIFFLAMVFIELTFLTM